VIRLGRSRRAAFAREYASRGRATWRSVEPAGAVEWPAPRRFGSATIDLDLPSRTPDFGVVELERGRLWGSHGWVIAADGTLLADLSWYGGPSDRMRIPRRLPHQRRLRGTCLSLVSDWSSANYAHFLLDAMGRLALFRKAGLSIDTVEHVCCPAPPSAAAEALLDRLAIPADKRIYAGPELAIDAEVLIVPSFPGSSLTYQPWLPAFLRNAANFRDAESPTRYLYISRRGASRHAVEEDAVETLMLERGFELYEPREHLNQPDDFDRAQVVVGAHGAGLANLAFCRPGTKVLELLPTDNAYPFYYSLAVSAALDYGYLACASTEKRPADAFGPSPYDFTVDLLELDAALDALL
jgi:capsular polysaccharide biosynthesis protein